MTVFLGTLWSSVKQINAPYVLVGEHEVAVQCMGIRPHLAVRQKSHGFSRVVAVTWGTFLSYGGNGHSKPKFVQ